MLAADLQYEDIVRDEPKRHYARKQPLVLAILFTVVAQGLLATAIALGGNPVVGVAAATLVALCGFLLVIAAGLQS